MKDFFADRDVRNADVEHSWVVRIMDLPTAKMRRNAIRILGSWITEEMKNLFGSFKQADCVVMATCVYMLECKAVRAAARKNGNAGYPLVEGAESAVWFYRFVMGALDKADAEKARVFLQLMNDGYMKPDVDRLLRLAEGFVPGDRVDVSLRN